MPTLLSVNVNRIALLRNSRDHGWTPDLIALSRIILEGGAHGITIHPRPDERHIRTADVAPLSDLVKQFPAAEFNIEGNPEHNLMALIAANRPQQATFVPDSTTQKTSDHGYSVEHLRRIKPLIAEAKRHANRVSVFVDADMASIRAAKNCGADRIELYTEPYALAPAATLQPFAEAATFARSIGLGVNAGHDLNLTNLPPFVREVRPDEVSIGHALIADALQFGMIETVSRYLSAVGAKP
ncbi:MAG: pyridoxine 5'-phosphate synthase [Betaproteobacteria bacterium]|nr:MAG: pyridoxine 5'-phosphate synthase [Betaproteobacteria bacterium]